MAHRPPSTANILMTEFPVAMSLPQEMLLLPFQLIWGGGAREEEHSWPTTPCATTATSAAK